MSLIKIAKRKAFFVSRIIASFEPKHIADILSWADGKLILYWDRKELCLYYMLQKGDKKTRIQSGEILVKQQDGNIFSMSEEKFKELYEEEA